MIKIWFESHSTTEDNEAGIASGWLDAELSELGVRRAKELGERLKDRNIDVVFRSDLKRAFQTATTALDSNEPKKIFGDWRLRECDYGDFSGKSSSLVEGERLKRLKEPFPGGESYEQCMERMKSFLDDLKAKFDGKTILIIGHRATFYGLEVHVAGKSLEQCLKDSPNWKWQPGWEYEL
jgi:broad specificity phosphatase PhoE